MCIGTPDGALDPVGGLIGRVTSTARAASADVVAGLAWRALAPHFKLGSGIRIKVTCDSEWVVYNDIFVDEEYDGPIRDTIAHGDPATPLQFLDLGANVGFFALRVAHLIALNAPHAPYRITMVEGSPSNFQTLGQRLREQPALEGRYRCANGLVGRRSGAGRIREPRFHGASSVVTQPGVTGRPVAYIDLEQLLGPECSSIHLLKCDVEGSEQEFIENYGTLLERVERAVFEFHHERCDVGTCLRRLATAGLRNHRRMRSFQDMLGLRSIEYVWR